MNNINLLAIYIAKTNFQLHVAEELLSQQSGSSKWHKFPGFLSTFGRGIEVGESHMQALVRELKE